MSIKFKMFLLIVFPLLLPLIIGKPYITHLLVICCIYSMLALSLNLAAGFLGQISLGHAAIYGIGAYTAAIMSLKFGVNIIFTIPVGAILAAGVSLIITSSAIKITGTYLTMITLGLNEITRIVLLNWDSLTRGPNGIPGIPSASIFGFSFDNAISNYYLVLFILIIEIIIIQKIINSRIGDSFIAIKGDEIAAASLGINIAKTKITGLTISAIFAGTAGVLSAHYIGYVNPNMYSSGFSIMILCMCIIGGLGSIPGSIIGATLYVLLPEILRFAEIWRMFIYGLFIVIIILYRPQGILGHKKTFRDLVVWNKKTSLDFKEKASNS